MGKVSATTVGGLLLLAMLLAPVTSGHTQQTLTVILTDDGVVAGNITDPAFVQGNAVWFKMEDSTNNTSMVVRVDVNMDGEFSPSEDFESPTLTNSCELDENGSLVDDTCAVSSTFAFDLNATVGTYVFWVHRSHNGSETVWTHSIAVHKDVHEEDGPSPGDCFGAGCEVQEETSVEGTEETSSLVVDQTLVRVLAVVSLFAMIALVASIGRDRNKEY